MKSDTKQAVKEAFRNGALEVEAVNPQTGAVGRYRLGDVLRHNTGHKPVVRVILRNGAEVTCTGDHSLFRCSDQGGVEPVRADGIQVGEAIAFVDGSQVRSEVVSSLGTLPPEQYTYDLSVPGPENFVLANGILAHNTYSIGGISLDLEKSSKYEGALSTSIEQFDKQLEKAKQTVNFVRGLQQPRFGVGIRSAFGPYSGAGVLSPRKFLGLAIPLVFASQHLFELFFRGLLLLS